jgi:histone acetyltransferase (RNA polymerase elongator complex component)
MNTKKNRSSLQQQPNLTYAQPDPQIQKPASSVQKPSTIEHPASSIQYPATRNRPLIIPIFLPHAGCPHQCIFCNQVSITGAKQKPAAADQVRIRIHEFLNYKNARRKPVQISFFGGNFLGLKTDQIKFYLTLAADFVQQGEVDSIRFSTRPDTIDVKHLDIIADYPVGTVELGVQSMNDYILALTKRGHNAADTVRAVKLLKARHYSIGLQMMVGLPGDDEASAMETARKISDLQPDFVRIYPTVVVKNSQLASWYNKGIYTPLSLEDAVALVKRLYLYFNKKNIQIIRMGLQASTDLADGSTVLAGPYHPAFGHMVYSEIFLNTACNAIKAADPFGSNVAIFVNPRRISAMKGLNNSNIDLIKTRFGFEKIRIVPDNDIDENSLKIDNENPMSCFASGDESTDL